VPELGVSVFEVPREHVKGRRRPRLVVCNSVAQSVIEAQRGKHEEFVFVYRRERVKNTDQAPAMPYRAIETMNNTAWQRARREAGLPDLHVHDLRHTWACGCAKRACRRAPSPTSCGTATRR
jgi:integrase